MKKALAILMVLALVASAATAEITFGAWGRGLFVPVQNTGADDEDNTATNGISWMNRNNPGNIRMGMTIKGVSENVGFQIDWNSDGESFGISDQNKIWVKPVSMVTVSIGHVFDDTLRGNACFGAWDWYRGYSVVGFDGGSEDFIFKRVDTGKQGFVVSVAPMDALYIVASFNDLANKQLTENLLGDFQIQGGYTIANIGQIRAQYIAVLQDEKEATSSSAYVIDQDPLSATYGTLILETTSTAAVDKEVAGTVEVAFKLTAIENLYADVGIRMVTNDDIQVNAKTVNLYASYKMDAMKFHLISQVKLYDDEFVLDADGDEISLGYMAGVGIDYALANSINIAGDIRFMDKNSSWIANGGAADTDKATVSYFAGITKGFSNGNIGAGFQVITNANTGYAIPVRLEYSTKTNLDGPRTNIKA